MTIKIIANLELELDGDISSTDDCKYTIIQDNKEINIITLFKKSLENFSIIDENIDYKISRGSFEVEDIMGL